MSFAQVDYLQKNRFSSTRFVEAADLLDKIKAIKSPEEQDLIRRGAACKTPPCARRSPRSSLEWHGPIDIYVNAADFCPHFAPKNPQFRHHAVTLPVPYEPRRA
jgi:hypothetical protein